MKKNLFDHQIMVTDQPQTCPVCGLRTVILSDLNHTEAKTQIHQCPDQKCGLQFLVSIEEEQELYFMEEPA